MIVSDFVKLDDIIKKSKNIYNDISDDLGKMKLLINSLSNAISSSSDIYYLCTVADQSSKELNDMNLMLNSCIYCLMGVRNGLIEFSNNMKSGIDQVISK